MLAHGRGATVTEIDIRLYDRRAGESKYQGLWRVVIGVTDLASVAFLVFFSRKPLLLFGASGLALAALGGLVAAGALYLRYLHPALGFEPYVPPFGYRLLIQLVVLARDARVPARGIRPGQRADRPRPARGRGAEAPARGRDTR